MYCVFCGSIGIILMDKYTDEDNNIHNGGMYYCNRCGNEFVVKYDPLRVLYND